MYHFVGRPSPICLLRNHASEFRSGWEKRGGRTKSISEGFFEKLINVRSRNVQKRSGLQEKSERGHDDKGGNGEKEAAGRDKGKCLEGGRPRASHISD